MTMRASVPRGTCLLAWLFLAGGLAAGQKAGPAVAAAFAASPPVATFVYPADGAVNADSTRPFEWTAVAGAQAYYLYVGTTPGAHDVINTGEIPATTYPMVSVPAGRVLYARIYTELGGLWRYSEITFTAASLSAAVFVYPADGAVNVDSTRPFEWTAVAGAQAYYLYVGTTPGAHDVINTGEIPATTYPMVSVPEGRVLYARIWTKMGGVWRYSEISFTAASPSLAAFVYPANGAVNVDTSRPFEWTAVAGAQAYYLYVGRTSGANDVINTGETLATTYPMESVPAAQALYARIWTEMGGVWRSSEITFTAAPVARFLYPADGAVNVDTSRPFEWTAVAGAQAYYLYVGTTPGAKDVINTGEIPATTYPMASVPAGQVLYAWIYTEMGGVWRHSGITFTASASAATFLYPIQGATSVDFARPFRWTPVAGAQAYALVIGSGPGAADLVSTGPILSTSYLSSGLPSTVVLYARLWTEIAGRWLSSDIAFTSLAAPPPVAVVSPQAGVDMDEGLPFQWSATDLADAYRLEIGTQPGGDDLEDSGPIGVTRRFVTGLPRSVDLFGRVSARLAGVWVSNTFSFRVSGETGSPGHRVESGLWAVDYVRHMADASNLPFDWTELGRVVRSAGGVSAFCTDYSQALLNILAAMNFGLPARGLSICMNTNYYDCHALIQASPDGGESWMLLDPTFDITMKRASDGGWARAEDVSDATQTADWGAIEYVTLGPEGDGFLRAYYLDYPLLYLNLFQNGEPIQVGSGLSPLPYLQPVAFPVDNQPGIYVLRSPGQVHVSISINGVAAELPLDGPDFLSYAFPARSIGAGPGVDPGTIQAYFPRRFVF